MQLGIEIWVAEFFADHLALDDKKKQDQQRAVWQLRHRKGGRVVNRGRREFDPTVLMFRQTLVRLIGYTVVS